MHLCPRPPRPPCAKPLPPCTPPTTTPTWLRLSHDSAVRCCWLCIRSRSRSSRSMRRRLVRLPGSWACTVCDVGWVGEQVSYRFGWVLGKHWGG